MTVTDGVVEVVATTVRAAALDLATIGAAKEISIGTQAVTKQASKQLTNAKAEALTTGERSMISEETVRQTLRIWTEAPTRTLWK